MFKSGSTRLSDEKRSTIINALNSTLSDGIDLHSQIKVAHWNIKGPHFVALHELFDQIASEIDGYNDEIAERITTLGGRANGTSRIVARSSRIEELPNATRDLELVALLADRLDRYATGLYQSQQTADETGDPETADLVTEVISGVEKRAWFLRATLE